MLLTKNREGPNPYLSVSQDPAGSQFPHWAAWLVSCRLTLRSSTCNGMLKDSKSILTSTCIQTLYFLQMSAIAMSGSNAPYTVVPAVALTRKGTNPYRKKHQESDPMKILIFRHNGKRMQLSTSNGSVWMKQRIKGPVLYPTFWCWCRCSCKVSKQMFLYFEMPSLTPTLPQNAAKPPLGLLHQSGKLDSKFKGM